MADIKQVGIFTVALLSAIAGLHTFATQSEPYNSQEFRHNVIRVFECSPGIWEIDGVLYTVKEAEDPFCTINGENIPYHVRMELEKRFMDIDRARRKILAGAETSQVMEKYGITTEELKKTDTIMR